MQATRRLDPNGRPVSWTTTQLYCLWVAIDALYPSSRPGVPSLMIEDVDAFTPEDLLFLRTKLIEFGTQQMVADLANAVTGNETAEEVAFEVDIVAFDFLDAALKLEMYGLPQPRELEESYNDMRTAAA